MTLIGLRVDKQNHEEEKGKGANGRADNHANQINPNSDAFGARGDDDDGHHERVIMTKR